MQDILNIIRNFKKCHVTPLGRFSVNTLSAGNIMSLTHTYSGRKLAKYEKSALFRKHVISSQLIVGFQ